MMMDGARFAKFAKDCGLVDKQLIATDVDLIFTKVKTKGQRCISFEQFCTALQQIATKKGVTQHVIVETAVASDGPVAAALISECCGY